MLATVALAAVAAVLCGNDVALVATQPLSVVRHAPLPARGAAVFAAPDGRVLVPIASDDATAVVDANGIVRVWKGRLFPLFFDEPDRMLAVVPGALLTVSYPERLPLDRVPLEGVEGAWRAACSTDGRLAAIIPMEGGRRTLLLAGTRGEGPHLSSELAVAAEAVAVAPDGGWVAIGYADGSVGLVVPGGASWRDATGLAGPVVALAVSDTGRDLVAAVEDAGGGAVVALRVAPGKKTPLRRLSVTRLPGAPSALAWAGDDVLAVAGGTLYRLTRRGRKIGGSVEVPGATGIAVLPEHPVSLVPDWSNDPGTGARAPSLGRGAGRSPRR